MKNGANAPGIGAAGRGVIAIVVCLAALVTRYGSVAVWIVVAHRRVRAVERRWLGGASLGTGATAVGLRPVPVASKRLTA
jgi:hypothetical protein